MNPANEGASPLFAEARAVHLGGRPQPADAVETQRNVAARRDTAALLLFTRERGTDGRSPEHVCTFASAAAARMLGRPAAEVVGLALDGLVDPASLAEIVEYVHRVATTGVAEEHTLPVQRGGSTVLLAGIAAPVQGGVAIALTDPTQCRSDDARVASMREGSARADRLSAQVLAGVADAYTLLDHDLCVVTVNRAAERLLAMDGAVLVGRPFLEVAPRNWADSNVADAVNSVRRNRAETHFTLRTPFGDREGERALHASDIDLYPAPDGGVAIFWRDVSDRVALDVFQRDFAANLTAWNQQLEASAEEQQRLLQVAEALRAEAEAANRSKTEFLTVMSHEFRTPLNAIGGYTELLELGLRGPITSEQREDLARIQRSSRHLLGLINALLNYAQLSAGRLTYDLADVVVMDAVRTTLSLVGSLVETQGLTLHLEECPPDVQMRTDADKLQQVLLNLLSNAVKFTPAGGTITVRCAQSAEMVTVAVTDTGIGIPARHLARIFEPFVQVDVGLSRTAGGVGLGLSISADLVRGLGGTMTVESVEGSGSTFTVALPATLRP